MRLGVSDPDNIWLAWDGEDRAVLGYCARIGGARAAPALAAVLCHRDPPGEAAGRRSGELVDVFEIEPGRDFRRPLKLPAGTQWLELLVRGEAEAAPLKSFVLMYDISGHQGALRVGTVFTTLPRVRCQFFWSDAEGYDFRDQRNVGWAGQFASWTTDDPTRKGAVTMVSRLNLIVPHSEETIRLTPGAYEYSDPESRGGHDLDAPAIQAASAAHKRVQSAPVHIHGPSTHLLQGLYLLHVSGHRSRAREWKNIIAMDETVFADIAARLGDKYEDALLGLEDWRELAGEAASQMHHALTGYYEWFSLTRPHLNVHVEEFDGGVTIHVLDASPGDHLVFYDAYGRNMRIGDARIAGGIAAFHVGSEALSHLPDEYTPHHRLVLEMFAEKPEEEFDAELGARLSLKPGMAAWMEEAGAPATPQGLAPLVADAVRLSEAAPAIVRRDWSRIAADGSAWLLAHRCDPQSLAKATAGAPSGASVLERALAVLGSRNALAEQTTLERKIAAAWSTLRMAGSPELAACLGRLDRFDPLTNDASGLAAEIGRIDAMMATPDFAEWLAAEDPSLHRTLRDHAGRPARISPSGLASAAAALESATARFDRFVREFATVTEGRETIAPVTPAETEPEAQSLIDALVAVDARAAERFRDFLSSQAGNAFAASRITAAIRTRYPGLEPAGNAELAAALRGLEASAGGRIDRAVIDAVASGARFYVGDFTACAQAAGERMRSAVAACEPVTARDRQIRGVLPDLAAAIAMHRMRGAIGDLVVRTRESGLSAPTRLLRSLMLWPRDSDQTWSGFLGFERANTAALGDRLDRLQAELLGERETEAA